MPLPLWLHFHQSSSPKPVYSRDCSTLVSSATAFLFYKFHLPSLLLFFGVWGSGKAINHWQHDGNGAQGVWPSRFQGLCPTNIMKRGVDLDVAVVSFPILPAFIFLSFLTNLIVCFFYSCRLHSEATFRVGGYLREVRRVN